MYVAVDVMHLLFFKSFLHSLSNSFILFCVGRHIPLDGSDQCRRLDTTGTNPRR